MRAFGKFLGRFLLTLLILGAELWFLGPYEKVDLTARFDPAALGRLIEGLRLAGLD